MIGTIIAAIVVGAIIGALGRLILPGKQNISLVMTILIGIVANVIVTFVVRQLGYSNSSGGIAWIPLILGAIVAAILIVVYGRVSHKAV
ncbi:GlsB/YeaQ/YmgE family stress response membrane protein [Terrabacter sp. NPDC080008]|uniref:GlsB/YeaQ/YmgE family stress response membrane protein n=1 Tax=Terrabacter sp. NPDC080008 TaxID=3155176 RepID=UPI003450CC30